MTCRKVQDMITPYIDSRLSGSEMLAVKGHLAECSRCAEEYEVLRQVSVLLRSLRVQQPPPASEERLLEVIQHRNTPSCNRLQRNIVVEQLMVRTFISLQGPNDLSRSQIQASVNRRRTAAAFALSAISILAAASPFGPDVSKFSARAFVRHNLMHRTMYTLATASGNAPMDLSAVNDSPAAESSFNYFVPANSYSSTFSEAGPGYMPVSYPSSLEGSQQRSPLTLNVRSLSEVTLADLPTR